ncbi:probable protein phosphatase 2C 26 isoform X2 [Solanum pennellii]|uniref:Protein phosphatase n=1 Tax=Solanum pennellii TaxID=28526 RepID=A0ABM1H409_SOLPN|nr:probable protein phosphatase 2C 26 isoform X2 [Solanum pennellii]
MAISILRPSISLPQHFLNSMNPQKFSSISVITKKHSFLHCVASDSAPSPSRQEMSLSVGMYLIPHPNKVEKGGEDAFFVSSDNGEVIVVADGVSGWAEKNVDPALFSRELVANVSSLVGNVEVNDDPRILIKGAHAATSSIGSATVIVSVFKNGILKIASVGDCGLRVIRKGQMIFSTFPLEHYFDCPYQLSSEAVTQTYLDAIVSTVNLQVGDTIIMGSDGLFDNIFDQEIVSVVTTNDDVSNTVV